MLEALCDIRDKRLYRERFDTFEDYLTEWVGGPEKVRRCLAYIDDAGMRVKAYATGSEASARSPPRRGNESPSMGRKLYVGNNPYSTGEAELQPLFSQAGTIDTVHVVTDRDTGRARGSAFVEMTTHEAAAGAINQFDQTEMEGRRITVNEALPKTRHGNGDGFQRRSEPRW